ncbi:gene transfer agent family protein, partial [Methylorubrum podarium]|uniref:gene transfer agent family protein n=1 Tax=Methylorubrum podarium TaxID=200476 RepID=UPI001EE2D65E
MANRRRGEVPLTLGAERYTLCLTLGALAELEDALGAGDLAGLAERFADGRLAARDVIALLGAALRGGIKTVLIPEENAKDIAEV